MTTKKKQQQIRVILKLPQRIADFLVRAQQIHDAMGANALVLSSPDPVLTKLQSDIDTLTTKEAAAKSHTEGAIADRDSAKDVVHNDLQLERAYVEKVANASPVDALSIAQDASMSLRKSPTRNKTELSATHGVVTGAVKLVAKAKAGAKANQWQHSVDGGKTWIDLPLTTKATTTVQSLTTGTTVSFRHRVLTKAGSSNWSDPVSLVVV